MAKMVTVEQRAVGVLDWNAVEQARIERNVVLRDGKVWEALRFCKNRNGRHNRVHLVIEEGDFVKLFRNAVENGVFAEQTLRDLRAVLEERRDPFLEVVGSATDGKLSSGIDDELYGDGKA